MHCTTTLCKYPYFTMLGHVRQNWRRRKSERQNCCDFALVAHLQTCKLFSVEEIRLHFRCAQFPRFVSQEYLLRETHTSKFGGIPLKHHPVILPKIPKSALWCPQLQRPLSQVPIVLDKFESPMWILHSSGTFCCMYCLWSRHTLLTTLYGHIHK